jgi:hypothetical protein
MDRREMMVSLTNILCQLEALQKGLKASGLTGYARQLGVRKNKIRAIIKRLEAEPEDRLGKFKHYVGYIEIVLVGIIRIINLLALFK